MTDARGMISTDFKGLKLQGRGKVRDIYEVDKCLLIVATDRISAFDVIMPNPIPGKGKILTGMSVFWFNRMNGIIENHLLSTDPFDFPDACLPYRKELEGRSMLVKKAKPLPVECVVRGYLSGSGWKDYRESGIYFRDRASAWIKRIRKTAGTPVYAFHQGPGREARHAHNKKRDGRYHRFQADGEDH